MLSNSELNRLDGVAKKYVDYVISGLTFSGGGGGSGTSGTSGIGVSGTSGTSGTRGTSGTSGLSGTSGINGLNGTSGINGLNGTSGTSGLSGVNGTSGVDGIGTNGTSGLTGETGTSGTSGSTSTLGVNNPIITSGVVYNQSIGAVAKTTIAGAANRLDLMPYIPIVSHTISSLSIDVTTLIAASNARILVYSSNVNGTPNSKLIESTNLDCSATGVKTYTVSYSFEAGVRYWIGVHWSSTQTLRGIPVSALISLGTPAAAGTTNYTLYRLSVTFGSAPATFTGGALTSSIGPEVRLLIS